MELNKENFIFYLKITLSILVIIAWFFWIINLPKAENKKSIIALKEEPEKDIKEESIKSLDLKLATTGKEIVKQNQKAIEVKSMAAQKVDLPKLANLEIPKSKEQNNKGIIPPNKDISVKENKKEQIAKDEKIQKAVDSTPETNIKLNFPTIAGATRQALLKNKSEPSTKKSDISLRDKIPINKDELKTQTRKIFHASNQPKEDFDFNESWLPKYITEKNEMKTKAENVTNSLDLIASQLELEGIINNPEGVNAAIIRNRKNNSIEILKIGEEYKGLKLLEVNKNEIKLVNESINKTYIKKIINNTEKN